MKIANYLHKNLAPNKLFRLKRAILYILYINRYMYDARLSVELD